MTEIKISKKSLFLFFNFILLYFIYIGLAGIAFPKQGVVSVVFPGIAFLFLIYLNINKTKPYKFSIWIYGFLAYLLILTLVSSDIFESVKSLIKVSISFLIFPLAFQFVRNYYLFKKVQRVVIVLMLLYLANFFIMNSLGISFKGYGEEITTGNIFTEGLNAMAYCLVILPVSIIMFKKNKWLIIILGAVVLITLLITLKRISILAVVFGYVVYFFSLKKKGGLIKAIIGITFLLFLLYPLYAEPLNKQIENRSSRFSDDSIENEGRYRETVIIFNNIFSFKDLPYTILGKELFNSPGTYGSEATWGQRQLHSDYNLLLHGSGILGLGWYFAVQGVILFMYKRLKKKIIFIYGYSREFDHINAAFMSVFWLTFFISLSGGINAVIFNSLRYLFLGSVMGLLYSGINLRYNNPFFQKNL